MVHQVWLLETVHAAADVMVKLVDPAEDGTLRLLVETTGQHEIVT